MKTPFIVLCTERTGSTHLLGLMRQHPLVEQYGEIFHPDIRFRDLVRRQRVSDKADGAEFTRWTFTAADIASARAVGFKLFYHHARTGPLSTVWSFLGGLEELRIIHLTRDNLLEAIVSHRLAEMSNVWHIRARYPPSRYAGLMARRPETLSLKPGDCMSYFERVEHDRMWAQQCLGAQSMCSIEYGRLRDDPNGCVRQVCDALSIPRFKPDMLFRKIETLPMNRRIANYDELRMAFAGTRFARFFKSSSLY